MSHRTALTEKLERAYALQALRQPVRVPPSAPEAAELADRVAVRALPPPRPDARIEGARVCEGRIKVPAAMRDELGWSTGIRLHLDVSKPGVMRVSSSGGDASVVLDKQGRIQLTELGRHHLQVDSGGQVTLLFDPSDAAILITNPGTVFALMAGQLAV